MNSLVEELELDILEIGKFLYYIEKVERSHNRNPMNHPQYIEFTNILKWLRHEYTLLYNSETR